MLFRSAFDDARIVACADPIRENRDRFVTKVNGVYGGQVCTPYEDFRELLARPGLDAVTICAPDYWHVAMATAAIRAGKDIYLEKPLSLAINWSLRLRREMAGKSLVFQFGTQQRSYAAFQQAVNLVRNGYIGQLQRIDAWCPEMRSRGKVPPERFFGSTRELPPPAGWNFDLWTGPAALGPYTEGLDTDWYHINNYCLGFMANWGVHPLDIAQWGANMDHSGPVSYEGIGTLPPKIGTFDTIEDWDVHCRYANGVKLRFMSRELAEPVVRRYHVVFRDHGTVFHGSEGWVGVDRAGLYSHNQNALRKVRFKATDRLVGAGRDHTLGDEQSLKVFQGDAGHQRNFLDCVRSRQPTVNPFETAVRGDTIVQLANICLRTKTPLEWDPQQEAIVNPTPAMTALLDRPMRAPYGV